MRPPNPADEAARLRVLAEFNILDTPPEADYDDIATLAARICGTPVALLTVMAADRQWYKARVGTDRIGVDREASPCAYTMLGRDLLVVPDARRDPRFADNPAVTAQPGLRFYAGAPLPSAEGHPLGTLCVLDRQPRWLAVERLRALRALGWQAAAQLELRRYGNAVSRAGGGVADTGGLRLDRIDLRALVRRAIEAVRPIAYLKHIRVPNQPAAPLPAVADPIRLEQALMRVLFAAIRHTPVGGRLRVVAAVTPGPTAHPARPRLTGSLAVAGLIVAQHHAMVSILDSPTEGTVLHVVLPEPPTIPAAPGEWAAARLLPASGS